MVNNSIGFWLVLKNKQVFKIFHLKVRIRSHFNGQTCLLVILQVSQGYKKASNFKG